MQKVWKWRRFLTDVGCGRYKMRHLQTKVGHLHTKGHGERHVGSLFRVDEPVPDDSLIFNQIYRKFFSETVNCQTVTQKIVFGNCYIVIL